MFGYLGRAWRGEERLSRVALWIGVVGNLAVILLIAAVQQLAQKHGLHGETYIGIGHGGRPYLGLKYLASNIFGLQLITWLPFSLICIWRCAPNVKNTKYTRWTRQLAIIVAALAVVNWLGITAVESE